MEKQNFIYASFAQRLVAYLIDTFIFGLALSPLFTLFFGDKNFTQQEINHIIQTQGIFGIISAKELIIQSVVFLTITIFFWVKFAGTPGKRILKMSVVDAATGQKLTLLQSLVRYLGYFVSGAPMLLGFFWPLFDPKKQAWHDKLAHSVVIIGNPAKQNEGSGNASTNSTNTFKA